MKLKTGILLIRWATLVAGLLMLAAIIAYLKSLGNFNYMICYGILAFCSVAVTLSKKYWIRAMFLRVKYPGLLYGVCEKLGYLNNLYIGSEDAILDDLYKPAYDTATFLADNGLKAEIYPSTTTLPLYTGLFQYAIPIGVLLYCLLAEHVKDTKYFLLAIPVSLAGNLLCRRLKRISDTGYEPQYAFTPEGLETPETMLAWAHVADWQYIMPTGRGEQPFMRILMTDTANNKSMCDLPIHTLAIGHVDFCIMMLHYKYKYGYAQG